MDQLIRCLECGTSFLWAAGEQTEAPPVRCPMCRRLAPLAGRTRGLVKWFSRGKGYGFITSVEGSEVFVHKSGLVASLALLRAGQLVEFTLGHGPRGTQAEEVRVLEPEGEAPAPQMI